MRNNGRQPGLLEQYSHLTGKRRESAIGSETTIGRKPTSRTVKKTTYGTIKRLMADRGFGFIQAEGKKEDIFFHRSSVQKVSFEDLKEGDFVEFEMQNDERSGKQSAINIKPAIKPKQRTSPRPEPTKGRIFMGWQEITAPFRQAGISNHRTTSRPGSHNKAKSDK